MAKLQVTRREVVAALTSPSLVAAIVAFYAAVTESSGFPQFVIWLAIFFGYRLTLFAGAPLWIWCKSKHGISWSRVLAGGAICGAAVPALMYVPVVMSSISTKNSWHTQQVIAELLKLAVGGGLLGMAIAVTFRLVAGPAKVTTQASRA